jgi:hypothetical protein
MAQCYAAFGNAQCTAGFSSLPDDAQWAEWQRISGNARPAADDETAEESAQPARQATGTDSGGNVAIPESPEPEPTVVVERLESPAAKPGPGEPDDGEDDDFEEPDNNRAAFLVRVDTAIKCAQFSGKATKESVRVARRAAEVWTKLADTLESLL